MASHSPVCPPLGTGSVDFNALNEAARKGKNLVEALEEAKKAAPATSAPVATGIPADDAPDAA